MAEPPLTTKERIVNVLARSVLAAALLLPYAARVRTFGWVFANVVAPLAGWRRRVERNLKLALPDIGAAERARLARIVPQNVGRTLIEIYSGEDFVARVKDARQSGPGLAALEAARDAGRPIILVTAHLGNYDAVRGTFTRQGYPIAALYKPMANRAFNDHYLKAISVIGSDLFPTDRQGIVGLVRHLKEGGVIGIVADVASTKAPVLSFFGQPAHTPLSAAEWAVQYDALLVPVFGIRQKDGLGFEIRVEEPIAHGPAEEMMQRYNDVVEAIVREDPGQWFWIHNRWKLGRAFAAELAASDGPS